MTRIAFVGMVSHPTFPSAFLMKGATMTPGISVACRVHVRLS